METGSTETMNLSINETHNNSNRLSVYKVPVVYPTLTFNLLIV